MKMPDHDQIRDSILFEITNSLPASHNKNDEYYSDSIHKLDWFQSDNFERQWVKYFIPPFAQAVSVMLADMAYDGIDLQNAWFQQYLKGGEHGWHIHSGHFTGVYYLEYSRGCSKTEVCSPYSLKPKKIDVVEGDIVIFPSHWIHRGLPNGERRKTIISFNFNAPANNRNALNLNKIKKGGFFK